MGATNAARSTRSPPRMAYAAAVAPREWATRAWAGPLAAPTAGRASANSRMVLRPGPAGPGSEAPWLGASKVTTRWPRSTSGPTNTSSCRPQPPQPWTRYTTGPAPQASPAPVWPLTWTWKGRPGAGAAARAGRALALGTVNHRVWAQRAPGAGATRSSIANDRTIVLFWMAASRLPGIGVSFRRLGQGLVGGRRAAGPRRRGGRGRGQI